MGRRLVYYLTLAYPLHAALSLPQHSNTALCAWHSSEGRLRERGGVGRDYDPASDVTIQRDGLPAVVRGGAAPSVPAAGGDSQDQRVSP